MTAPRRAPRTSRLEVRVSAAELERVRACAAARGLDVAEWARSALANACDVQEAAALMAMVSPTRRVVDPDPCEGGECGRGDRHDPRQCAKHAKVGLD